MTGKRLTPTQANAALPLVRAVVADVVDLTARLSRADTEYRAERARPLPSQALLNERRRGMRDLERELSSCRAELAAVSARVEDAAAGVVDFDGDLDGAPVLLCWRLGEDHVDHWHGLDEPTASRRPLPVAVQA